MNLQTKHKLEIYSHLLLKKMLSSVRSKSKSRYTVNHAEITTKRRAGSLWKWRPGLRAQRMFTSSERPPHILTSSPSVGKVHCTVTWTELKRLHFNPASSITKLVSWFGLLLCTGWSERKCPAVSGENKWSYAVNGTRMIETQCLRHSYWRYLASLSTSLNLLKPTGHVMHQPV
jgi:hypothetical protein